MSSNVQARQLTQTTRSTKSATSVPQLVRRGAGIWYIVWSESRRSKRISTKTDELATACIRFGRWLLRNEPDARALGHDPTPVRPDDIITGELWSRYVREHVQSKVVAQSTLRFVWQNLGPFFGPMAPRNILQPVVDEYERLRQAGAIGRPSKASTIRRELVSLNACLNWAASRKRRYLHPEELPAFDLPRESLPRDRWLRVDEIRQLLISASQLRFGDKRRLSRVERFLWLGLETAARKEAILNLTWDRVDFETGMIQFAEPGRVLTKKRRGAVPMSRRLRTVLTVAYAERKSERVMDHGGEPLRRLARIARHAGVPDVSPHVLRHTAATNMARRGVPLWQVAGVLAITLRLCERTYAHHVPSALAEAVEQISGESLDDLLPSAPNPSS